MGGVAAGATGAAGEGSEVGGTGGVCADTSCERCKVESARLKSMLNGVRVFMGKPLRVVNVAKCYRNTSFFRFLLPLAAQ